MESQVMDVVDMLKLGSGCGSVGRAIASNSGDYRVKSQHQQKGTYQLFISIEKMKIKKRGRNGPSITKCSWLLRFALQ